MQSEIFNKEIISVRTYSNNNWFLRIACSHKDVESTEDIFQETLILVFIIEI